MVAELIDRRKLKKEITTLLADAQVSPKGMVALYMGVLLALSLVESFVQTGLLATFISVLVSLMSSVLTAGFVLYCMAIRRGERAEYLTLFDGFSFVFKVIALDIVTSLLIWAWSLLFLIPGIIAGYRYRFALYNLYENPGIGVMEALEMSKRQTLGYKTQLFWLDLSYMGWTLFAAFPACIYTGFMYQSIVQDAMSYAGIGTISATVSESGVMGLPFWAWLLGAGLWQLVVSVFYLAHQQCADLGYFEIAKRTSGVESSFRRDHDRTAGPDNLGGF